MPTCELRDRAATLASLRDDKAWALSYTLDDGFTSQATTAKSLHDRYGYRALSSSLGPRIGTGHSGKSYASSEQLQAWSPRLAVANHTSSHLYASELGGETPLSRHSATNQAIATAEPGYAPTCSPPPLPTRPICPIVKGP